MNKQVNNKNSLIYIILITGVIFMGIGIFRGENLDVLGKAIRVCLECIGIG